MREGVWSARKFPSWILFLDTQVRSAIVYCGAVENFNSTAFCAIVSQGVRCGWMYETHEWFTKVGKETTRFKILYACMFMVWFEMAFWYLKPSPRWMFRRVEVASHEVFVLWSVWVSAFQSAFFMLMCVCSLVIGAVYLSPSLILPREADDGVRLVILGAAGLFVIHDLL